MIPEKLITFTARKLDFLCNAKRVKEWALVHLVEVEQFEEGYNELITTFNKYSGYTYFDFMPRTHILKYILNGRPLPFTSEMNGFMIIGGLKDARQPIFLGQRIRKGDCKNPDGDFKQFAIETPSMDTTEDALVVGTMGHLIERAFFRWALKQGIEPKGKWEKDMLLKALGEILLLENAKENSLLLFPYFTKPNSEGGLGWLSRDAIAAFHTKLANLSHKISITA